LSAVSTTTNPVFTAEVAGDNPMITVFALTL